MAAECKRNNVPIALFGLGVAEAALDAGAGLISSLLHLTNWCFAGVRDGDSAKRLRQRRVKGVVVTPDPGLMHLRWGPSLCGDSANALSLASDTHPLFATSRRGKVR